MSKKDKTKEQQEQPKALTLVDVLKDIEGVTVSDDKRLRVTAADKDELGKRVDGVKEALDDYNVTVSPVYGDAAAVGCVWNDIVATLKK